jgi:hypothetical protein
MIFNYVAHPRRSGALVGVKAALARLSSTIDASFITVQKRKKGNTQPGVVVHGLKKLQTAVRRDCMQGDIGGAWRTWQKIQRLGAMPQPATFDMLLPALLRDSAFDKALDVVRVGAASKPQSLISPTILGQGLQQLPQFGNADDAYTFIDEAATAAFAATPEPELGDFFRRQCMGIALEFLEEASGALAAIGEIQRKGDRQPPNSSALERMGKAKTGIRLSAGARKGEVLCNVRIDYGRGRDEERGVQSGDIVGLMLMSQHQRFLSLSPQRQASGSMREESLVGDVCAVLHHHGGACAPSTLRTEVYQMNTHNMSAMRAAGGAKQLCLKHPEQLSFDPGVDTGSGLDEGTIGLCAVRANVGGATVGGASAGGASAGGASAGASRVGFSGQIRALGQLMVECVVVNTTPLVVKPLLTRDVDIMLAEAARNKGVSSLQVK